MVPVRNTMRIPIHSVLTPRIVPRTVKKEVDTCTGTSPTVATTGAAGTSSTSSTADPSDPAANFKALFGHVNSAASTTVPPPAVPKPAAPTLQSIFGANPYVSNPGGVAPNGVSYGYNPTYFATRATADKLAQMYGGKVVEMNAITPYGPFSQNQMNEMIQFPNGNVINAGILASYFDHGWSQEQINSAISAEISTFPG